MRSDNFCTIVCDKCGKEQAGAGVGVIGKRHKACIKRKSGETKKNCGKWTHKG